MSRILVTGGAGFIAGRLAEKLSHNSADQVVVVDNMQTGSRDNVPAGAHGNVHFIKADVNDRQDISAVFFAYRFDYVFHYAATVGVKRTLKNPVMVLNDINGIRNILDLSKNTGVKRVYFAGSSEVYGEPVEIPQNELTTPLNSRLPYAIVKNIGEAFLRSYKQEFGLDYTVFRFFNTYGPTQSPDFVVAKFLRAALAGEPLKVYGEGRQTRTFCYIDDNIDACLAAHYNGEAVNDVINIGSDKEITVLELARKIIEITGSSSEIVHRPPLEEGDMTRRMPDNSRMMGLLKRDLIPLDAGLRKILEAYTSLSR